VRATKIVRRLCAGCLEQVHAVLRTVEALIVAQRVSLTAIGRAVRGGVQPRHGIKMMDRLLGNPKLQGECRMWFTALARTLIGSERRVVVLLDWTKLHGEFWALIAGVAYHGRSLPILGEAHHKRNVGSRKIQTEFVRQLRRMFPRDCRVVIVADGGFRSPFFTACREAGVDFVIRLRNENGMARVDKGPRGHKRYDAVSFGTIFAWARGAAKCLGLGAPFITSDACGQCRLVLGAAPRKARKRARYADDYERKRACEPWLLATSLENEAAASVVAIYATRIQVEECFRDAKNARFGWGLEFAKSRSKERLNVLLLLVALAFAAVVLVGSAADAAGLEKRFRASSRKQRVLSLFSLGNLVVRSGELARLSLQIVWDQLATVRAVTRALLPPIDEVAHDPRRRHHDLFCSDLRLAFRNFIRLSNRFVGIAQDVLWRSRLSPVIKWLAAQAVAQARVGADPCADASADASADATAGRATARLGRREGGRDERGEAGERERPEASAARVGVPRYGGHATTSSGEAGCRPQSSGSRA
jgi:hypothetical protein